MPDQQVVDCGYFGPPTGRDLNGLPIFKCGLHGECVTTGGQRVPVCDRCPDRVPLTAPEWPDKWRDPLVVYDRQKHRNDGLRDLLAGRAAFVVCGGPSANAEKLERLNERGIFTLAVNNMAGHSRFRANAFVCSDPPSKFSYSIWQDPAIIKLIPRPKMTGGRARIRRRGPDGVLANVQIGHREYMTTEMCPNVWGFDRRSWLRPDDSFFTEPDAAWGNHDDGAAQTGEEKTVGTFMLALRLIRYLGARRVFLVGADFGMAGDRGDLGNYAFAQARDIDAVVANNAQYRIQNAWLCKMQETGVFARFGLEVYNCNERSRLRAFPFVPFAAALAAVRGDVEERPDLSSWYDR